MHFQHNPDALLQHLAPLLCTMQAARRGVEVPYSQQEALLLLDTHSMLQLLDPGLFLLQPREVHLLQTIQEPRMPRGTALQHHVCDVLQHLPGVVDVHLQYAPWVMRTAYDAVLTHVGSGRRVVVVTVPSKLVFRNAPHEPTLRVGLMVAMARRAGLACVVVTQAVWDGWQGGEGHVVGLMGAVEVAVNELNRETEESEKPVYVHIHV